MSINNRHKRSWVTKKVPCRGAIGRALWGVEGDGGHDARLSELRGGRYSLLPSLALRAEARGSRSLAAAEVHRGAGRVIRVGETKTLNCFVAPVRAGGLRIVLSRFFKIGTFLPCARGLIWLQNPR